MLGRRAGDAAQDVPSNAKLTMGYDDIAQLAKDRARSNDPQLHQELARLYTDTRTGLWNAQRGKAEAARGGGQAVASIGKLTQTNIVKRAARLGVEILGADGTLADGDGVESGVYAKAFVFSAADRKSTRLNSSHS